MQKSQLINILQTFSKKEIRDCRKWLQSPVHNQREDVILLFDYIVENGNLEDEEALNKCTAFPFVFPEEPYDDAKMRQVMYFLLKAVEEFLIYEEVLQNEVDVKVNLARIYRKRKLSKYFTKTIKQAQSLHTDFRFKNEEFHQNEYKIQQEKYTAQEDQIRNVEMNLQEVTNALDVFYFASKLRQSCHMLAHQKVYKTTYDFGLIDDILTNIEQNDLLLVPGIAIYYHGYKMITDEANDKHFGSLKKEIEFNEKYFPNSERKDIYLMAINYCIGRANTGKGEYVREAFELFRRGIENHVFIEDGILNHYTFRNTVTAGLSLSEFEWVEGFILKYQTYLEEKYRESFTNFCLARLNYTKGDYNKAMQLLVQFDYSDILITLSGKAMLIKIYYEQEELDALESLLSSTNTYLQRKKVMGYHKSNYKNIIRFTKKLIRVNPYEKEGREKLQKEISEANPLTEKQWLLEQLEKL